MSAALRRMAGVLPLAASMLFGLALTGCGKDQEEAPPSTAPKVDPATLVMSDATLYFPDEEGRLTGLASELPQEPLELRIHRAVELLIAGPPESSEGVFPLLPRETTVGGVLVAEGVAYVNLVGKDGAQPPAIGSADERLILFSLVDTVVLNTPGVDRAVFLWNGNQRETFAGHYDTTRPLPADRSLLRSTDG